MKISFRSCIGREWLVVALELAFLLACGSSQQEDSQSSGGHAATQAGSDGSGGATAESGGSFTAGGTQSGGVSPTGGAAKTGGANESGGVAQSGGSPSDGMDASVDASLDAGLDAAVGTVDCHGTSANSFPTFDLHCATAQDCALVVRTLSCCGTRLVTAVNASVADAFATAAAQCDQQLAACGCAQGPTQADDGTIATSDNPYASTSCVAKQCTTSFSEPATTPCGPSLTCDATLEMCVTRSPIGPSIQYDCVSIPATCYDTRDCGCAAESLCTGSFNTCVDAAPNRIDCICPTCQ